MLKYMLNIFLYNVNVECRLIMVVAVKEGFSSILGVISPRGTGGST